MFADMSNSIPGVDEAMSFAELMKMVQNMNFSCIVFDTAPTGHTLRLLSFPAIMDKALSKLMDLKNRFSGLFSQFGSMFGAGGVRENPGRLTRLVYSRNYSTGQNFPRKLFLLPCHGSYRKRSFIGRAILSCPVLSSDGGRFPVRGYRPPRTTCSASCCS